MANAKLVTHGSVAGVPIQVDMARIEHGFTVRVTLTAKYSMLHVPGTPTRPCFTGAAAQSLDYPRDVASGTVLVLNKGEADALVTASAAVYS